MKLEDQVCSLELAKRLKELGVKQESFAYWQDHGIKGVELIWDRNAECDMSDYFSAFTVAELGELFPSQIASHRVEDADPFYWISWARDRFNRGHVHSQQAPTEADARAKMLIYLIEQKLVTP